MSDSFKSCFLLVALFIKFIISLILLLPIYAFIYTMAIGIVSYCLLKYNFKMFNYMMLIMVDFMFGFILIFNQIGINLIALVLSFLYFIVSGCFVYIILINSLGEKTSSKRMRSISNIEVDKGIKALENDDYQSAIDYFSKAIKDNKSNYLGYMGMCNTLFKYDAKNSKKLNYYKNKCIKYAPKELKESIKIRYY